MNAHRIRYTIVLVSLALHAGCFDPPATAGGTEGSSSGSDTAQASVGAGTMMVTSTSGSGGANEGSESGPPGPPPQPMHRSTVIMQTSGGGRTASTMISAQVYIGAPQPAGRSSSARHRAHLGPGSI